MSSVKSGKAKHASSGAVDFSFPREGAEDAGATDKDQEGVAVIEAYLGERIDTFLGDASVERLRRKLFKVLWSLYRERKAHSATHQRLLWTGEQLEELQVQGNELMGRLQRTEEENDRMQTEMAKSSQQQVSALKQEATQNHSEADKWKRLADSSRNELAKCKEKVERLERSKAAAELRARAHKDLADTSLKSSSTSEQVAGMWEKRMKAAEDAANVRVQAAEKEQAELLRRVLDLQQQLQEARATPAPCSSPTLPSGQAAEPSALDAAPRTPGQLTLAESLHKCGLAEKRIAIMSGQMQIIRAELQRYKQLHAASKENQRLQRSMASGGGPPSRPPTLKASAVKSDLLSGGSGAATESPTKQGVRTPTRACSPGPEHLEISPPKAPPSLPSSGRSAATGLSCSPKQRAPEQPAQWQINLDPREIGLSHEDDDDEPELVIASANDGIIKLPRYS